ncbi:MAG TPA: agmatinase [Vicinamibacterales bacterium]|nr:agmatinase [Vicinamibacterales bacterium]
MNGRPALVGLPYDASSSFLRGAARGPTHVRDALFSPAGNGWSELMVDVLSPPQGLEDLGDLDLPPDDRARDRIEAAIGSLVADDRRFIALGGDHSVTYPILRSLSRRAGPITILQIDAHPDLYDTFDGERHSHACPFARIMEEGLAARLVQVGIRAMSGPQIEQVRRFHVEQFPMRAWADGARPSLVGDVYVSIDLDGLDPSCAPGVSHPEPGGLTVRDVLGLLHTLTGRLIGADIVELNPARDPSGVTAGVAAKFVKELTAGFLVDGA